ncbi:MAG: hypothetical protein H8D23_37620 [Candidatus Brocadiales bacterium]|nr:hypothetical protein [Candidatus Brocadiales bacterium]
MKKQIIISFIAGVICTAATLMITRAGAQTVHVSYDECTVEMSVNAVDKVRDAIERRYGTDGDTEGIFRALSAMMSQRCGQIILKSKGH